MSKPLTAYPFTILTDDEADELRASVEHHSWERALLDGRMLRFARRPRFTQTMRLKVQQSGKVTKSLSKDGSVYLWLEEPAEE